MIPVYLVSMGLNVDLLSDTDNACRVRSMLTSERVVKHLNQGRDHLLGLSVERKEGRLNYLDSSDRRAPWRLLRNLRSGHAAVIFPDGNSGVPGDDAHQGNSVVGTLLGRSVLVRSGPAILAYAAGTFVLPVFPYFEGERTCLRVDRPIHPEPGESLQEYRDRVSTTLFSLLDAEIADRPHEWEEWHNFFRWICAPPPSTESDRVEDGVASEDSAAIPSDANLVLVESSLWRLMIGDERHVVDVSAWQSLGVDQELGRLVDLAEQEATVGTWRSAVRDSAAAQAAFSFLLSRGWIRVRLP
jgi:hypothetical protein